jgi:multiple sugar transport system substrate-binding protein
MLTREAKGSIALRLRTSLSRIAILGTFLAGSISAIQPSHAASQMNLRIAWFKWPPADLLIQIGQLYTKSHPNVTISVDEPPSSQWYSSAFNQFAQHKTTFDAAVGDSQWLGQGAVDHYYVDLTSWLKANMPVHDFIPALLAAYGQYPQGIPGTTGGLNLATGHFYGIPWEADALTWAYRKDWFSDPANQAAFKKKYGYPLAVPKTMDQLVDIADFFTNPAKGQYGIAFHEQNNYDCAAEAFNEFLWNYGGDLWNPKTHQIQGYVNSDRALHALQVMIHLTHDAPPGNGNYCFNDVNSAMNQGKIAMANNWFGFMPGLRDPSASTLGKTVAQIDQKVGYFITPGETYEGVTSHAVALGGQGISISAFAPPDHQKAMLDFIKWFESPAIQLIWVKTGVGGSANIKTLQSATFLNSSPFAKLEVPAFSIARDFWNVPQYAQMLTVLTGNVNKALTGQMDPKAALDDIATKQTAILNGGQ